MSTAFCLNIYEDFEIFKGKKLVNIFDLNYNKIFVCSILTLVFSCMLVLTFVFGVYCGECIDCCDCCARPRGRSPEKVSCPSRNIIFYTIFLLIYGIRFVMSFIIFYYMEKGDIEKYDNFLDCQIAKVNYIKDSITNVNLLRVCFYGFVIMNFILLGIEKIESYLEYAAKAFDKENEIKERKETPRPERVLYSNNSYIIPTSIN